MFLFLTCFSMILGWSVLFWNSWNFSKIRLWADPVGCIRKVAAYFQTLDLDVCLALSRDTSCLLVHIPPVSVHRLDAALVACSMMTQGDLLQQPTDTWDLPQGQRRFIFFTFCVFVSPKHWKHGASSGPRIWLVCVFVSSTLKSWNVQ